jgi:hypothetical protein
MLAGLERTIFERLSKHPGIAKSKLEATTTRSADGLAFTARGSKSQGCQNLHLLRVKPAAWHPVWKTQH